MGVITQQIEARFQMPLTDLRRAVAAAPQANMEATGVVRWYGLLAEALDVLETAEAALVAVLGTEPGELDDPAMELAHQVNTAVAVRDGRALVVTYLLDPKVPGKRDPRGPAPAVLRGPALSTAPATVPGARAVPVRGGGWRDEREGEIQQPGRASGEGVRAT
ncbi:hypothetical protein [Streptomyces violaceus]|uniref:Uncharacterized protein n=1 Tax=Streptomyces violaceus TaxID=1936 RepID=A0ABZ1NMN6_STRVL